MIKEIVVVRNSKISEEIIKAKKERGMLSKNIIGYDKYNQPILSNECYRWRYGSKWLFTLKPRVFKTDINKPWIDTIKTTVFISNN